MAEATPESAGSTIPCTPQVETVDGYDWGTHSTSAAGSSGPAVTTTGPVGVENLAALVADVAARVSRELTPQVFTNQRDVPEPAEEPGYGAVGDYRNDPDILASCQRAVGPPRLRKEDVLPLKKTRMTKPGVVRPKPPEVPLFDPSPGGSPSSMGVAIL